MLNRAPLRSDNVYKHVWHVFFIQNFVAPGFDYSTFIMVLKQLAAFDRGRIPAHHMWQVRESLDILVQLQTDDGKCRKRMLEAGAPLEFLSSRYCNSLNDMVNSNFVLLTNHYISYDMWSRPYHLYDLPCVDNIYEQFSSHRFYELTGFWPVQVQEIC